jgi:tRNA-Thr(GGU) m(6)t(6)A37 methyltransferase TsaA
VSDDRYVLQPVGRVESALRDRDSAPRQGDEGAPVARIVLFEEFADAARDLTPGDEVIVLTWLHLADRDVQSVHPRGDERRPLTGVFATRASDRPNPIGLHSVMIKSISGATLTVLNLEAIDGTPVLDIKPILHRISDR